MVLPFIMVFIYLAKYRKKKLDLFQNKLIYERPPTHFYRKVFYLLASWIFAVISLMGPYGNSHYLENKNNGGVNNKENIILLIDTSQSMAVEDVRTGRSRLNLSKEIADEIISNLKGQNLAIDTFTSDLAQLVPLTPDYIFSRIVLKNIGINYEGQKGTDFVNVINNLLTTDSKEPTTIILLSDGGDLLYEGDNKVIKEKRYRELSEIIKKEKWPNLSIISIGVGSNEGKEIPNVVKDSKPVISKLNPDLLQLLAKETNGYYFIADKYSLEDLSKKILEKINDKKIKNEPHEKIETVVVYDLYFQKPLTFAIILLAIYLITPDNWQYEREP